MIQEAKEKKRWGIRNTVKSLVTQKKPKYRKQLPKDDQQKAIAIHLFPEEGEEKKVLERNELIQRRSGQDQEKKPIASKRKHNCIFIHFHFAL
jgi:hypothetical protein